MISRRRLFSRTLGIAALGLAGPWFSSGMAQAQEAANWPKQPVRLVVGLAPGGIADVMARIVQNPLSEALGQPVIVENRPGAGGNIASAEIGNNGDNFSFLVVPTTTESVNPLLYSSMPVSFDKDLQPVGLLANSYLFLLVKDAVPAKTLPEFIEYLKANPTQLSFGSAGNGTTPHLAGALLNDRAGTAAAHVPYRGLGPAVQDLMAGQIDYLFGPMSFLPMVESGKIRLLGTATRERPERFAELPILDEVGMEQVYADSMFGVYTHQSVPADIVNKMNAELNKVLAMPATQERFAELGAIAMPQTPAEFKQLVDAEKELFTPVLKALDIKVD